LWLGTQTGLVRFDGARFATADTIFPSAPTGIWIRSLAEGPHGELYLGTNESGIYRIAGNTITHFTTKEGLPADTITSLTSVHDALWTGPPPGLPRLTNDKITVFHTADGLPSNDVRAVAVTADGKIWIGTDTPKLATWNGSQFELRPLKSIPADAGVR